MNRSERWWLAGWSWVALFFRLTGLFTNRFHADEALFASFAQKIFTWHDFWLRGQPVDKPPLLFYTQALFFPLLGPTEFAARLPNFIVSILLVPLTGLLAWRLFGQGKTAVAAAAITACSPLAVQFSSTAFLDPFLTFWLVAALLALTLRKPTLSGLLFGLAVASKYQAILFMPLLWGLGWLRCWSWANWRRWLTGLLLMLLLLLAWELNRTGSVRLWSAQMANFGGVRISRSWELLPRGQDWLALGGQAFGSIWLGSAVLVLLAAAGIYAGRGRDLPVLQVQMLLLFGVGYLLLHWLLAIPVWDRYLLPLLPLLAVVLGWVLVKVRGRLVVAGLLVGLLVWGGWGARNGRFPIGGQQNADQGAAVVAAALADAPYGTVLYDHWYSWQWRYHLFNQKVFVSWQPSPAALAEEILVFGADGNAHYLVLPDSEGARPFIRAVESAQFSLFPVPLAAPVQMRLYEIIPNE